ncbi:MAG: hypothetical protein ACO3A2_06940 [Bdellovibrionia bacterium]
MREPRSIPFCIRIAVFSTALGFGTLPGSCPLQADPFPPPSLSIPEANALLPESSANSLVQTVGLCFMHRPYEPATSEATIFDLGVEATLAQAPSSLAQAFSTLTSVDGSSNSPMSIPFLPSPKLHLRKGFNDTWDGGISALYIPSQIPYLGNTLILGGDLKAALTHPEEGPLIAFRGAYTFTQFNLSYQDYSLLTQTATFSPMLLISRKLNFADPYLGAGYQYTWGSVRLSVQNPSQLAQLGPGTALSPFSVTQNGSAQGLFFFLGLSIKTPAKLRISIEGSYSPTGINTLGTKIGFTL